MISVIKSQSPRKKDLSEKREINLKELKTDLQGRERDIMMMLLQVVKEEVLQTEEEASEAAEAAIEETEATTEVAEVAEELLDRALMIVIYQTTLEVEAEVLPEVNSEEEEDINPEVDMSPEVDTKEDVDMKAEEVTTVTEKVQEEEVIM